MLLNCPECDLQVSDKALTCPHCGYPMKSTVKYKKSYKVKRLPNGFGRITEIRNKNLRKPFRTMVTVGKTSTGLPIGKILGYFETYNKAYEALVEYNKNPYDLDDGLTVKEVYEKWKEIYFDTLKNSSSIRTITAAWKYCSSIYDMKIRDLRARHIKGCMDDGYIIDGNDKKYPSPGMKARIKSMFNLMLDYALEYELIDKNYSRTFKISDNVLEEMEEMKRAHITFSDEEMRILWKHVNSFPYVDLLLIQCYMGWRPQELCKIETIDVDLDKGTITGGMKTNAGYRRCVPIHHKIFTLIERRLEEAKEVNSKYLFNTVESKRSLHLTYDKYNVRFNKIVNALKLNPNHRPHDPRCYFISMLKKYKVDEYAIKKLAGHKISDITEAIYTTRPDNWLEEEFNKIP